MAKLLQDSPDEAALPLYRHAPTYPSSALRDGVTGHVRFEFDVDKNGFVTDPVVTELVGREDLIPSAEKALMRFRYAPRIVDSEAAVRPGVKTMITFQSLQQCAVPVIQDVAAALACGRRDAWRSSQVEAGRQGHAKTVIG